MGDDTSLLIEDLEDFGNYTIEVRAHNSAGAGPYSSPEDVQTLPESKKRATQCIVHHYESASNLAVGKKRGTNRIGGWEE